MWSSISSGSGLSQRLMTRKMSPMTRTPERLRQVQIRSTIHLRNRKAVPRERARTAIHRCIRLILSFDSQANAFVGTVENTTENKLCAIRVEVHLDSGTELGPTARVDLTAGQTTSVTLATGGEAFEAFTAHPEMSPCGDS